MIKFQECVQQVGIQSGIGLRLDVPTRWNSTYLMLESVIQYEKAFDILQVVDRNYKHFPTNEEWRRAEKVCEFLEPFYETTNMVSSSYYPTSNLYFLQVWKIECMLNDNLSNDDGIIRDMSMLMKEKFDKYWKEYSVVLAFGAVLDPQMKLDFLEFCFKKVEPATAKVKVEHVKNKLEKLYGEYSNSFNASGTLCSQSSNESTMSQRISTSVEGSKHKKAKMIFNEFKMFKNESSFDIGKTELNIYLGEVGLDFDENEELDILQYWKNTEKRFPTLSILARDVLSIPITTVASESTFSIGGRVLTKYRSSTLPENVQMLICARSWLYGFVNIPNDEEECVTCSPETMETNILEEDENED